MPNRHGFTLVELVLSMAIMTILMGAMASAVLIATHALPDDQSPSTAAVDGSEVLDRIAGDLLAGTSFPEMTARSVTLTVADRNGDKAPETIRYAWSGTPGDSLTRQYNGGTVVKLVAEVQEFALDYVLTTVTEEHDPVTKESAEQVLCSYDTPVVAADFAITETEWIGQYFFPSLAADVTAWKVTRVSFMARIHGADKGITAVQIRLPTGADLPSPTVLEEVLMYENSLGESYSWKEFAFSNVSGLSPTQGLCLVLALNKKEAHLADIQYDSGGGSGRLTTTDAGSTWSSDAGQSMLYYVYGTVTTTTTPDPTIRQWLRSVGITLRIGKDPSGRVETATQVLNAPEVTGS